MGESVNMRSAVFLDRDGTMIKTFPNRPANTVEEIELLPGVPDAMIELKKCGLLTVVVTNQGGVGLGYMSLQTLKDMNERLNELLTLADAPTVDAFYWCAHAPREGCECRKPRPGMLIKAQDDLNIDFHSSYMVGDDVRDMEAAVYAGIKWPLMVVSDRYQDTPMARMLFPDLKSAAKIIKVLEDNK